MNTSGQEQLESVIREQALLRERLSRLDLEIAALRDGTARPAEIPAPPPPVPPSKPSVPPPLPASAFAPPVPATPFVAPGKAASPSVPPTPEPPAESSLEMRVGTYWLVRAGIVLLLTGLVFLGNYAYQNYFGQLGPAARLAFFYLASGALTGLGLWVEKRGEGVRNYARVLAAGGMAAVYYTTYAAHYVDRLRVIESPLLAGILLLAWAGCIAWLADRRRSQTLAVFAVALALFTSGMSHIAGFTLLSNLILATVAMGMLLRHGWRTLAFVTLVGTYGAFAVWRTVLGDGLWEAVPAGDLAPRVAFLSLYWLVFTAGGLLAAPGLFGRKPRVGFLTLNNGLFFVLAVTAFLPFGEHEFSNLAFVFGIALAGLAWFCFRREALREGIFPAFLGQALLFFTLAVLTRFTGSNLALILVVEAAFLAAAWGRFPLFALRAGALAVAGLAAIAGGIAVNEGNAPWAVTLVAATLFGLAVFADHRAPAARVVAPRADGFLYGLGGFIAAAALIMELSRGDARLVWFSLLAVAATFSLPFLRSPGLLIAGQFSLIAAVLGFLFRFTEGNPSPWPLLAPLVAASAIGVALHGLADNPRGLGALWAALCRTVAVLLYGLWVLEFIDRESQFLFLALTATALVVLKSGGALRGCFALALNIAGVFAALVNLDELGRLGAGDLTGWLLLLVQGKMFAQFAAWPGAQAWARTGLAAAGLGGLWLQLTHWVGTREGDYPLTAFWALLALAYLVGGFLFRERLYRSAAFLLLALCIGRIFLVDVWEYGTLVRILSFMVLGAVLLVLGFLYNRFQDKIRSWL